eukprot:g54137.t1
MSLVESVEPWVKNIRQGKNPQAEMPVTGVGRLTRLAVSTRGSAAFLVQTWLACLAKFYRKLCEVDLVKSCQNLSRGVRTVDEFPSLEDCVMADLGHPAEYGENYSFRQDKAEFIV